MENASKALIIAGAILLSILIIGISMFIFNSGNETIEKTVSRMNEQERLTHNQRFQKFEGPRRSGTDVKSLLNELIQNNATQVRDGEPNRIPGVTFGNVNIVPTVGATTEFNTMMTNVRTTRSYNVEVLLNAENGIVNQINITENQ